VGDSRGDWVRGGGSWCHWVRGSCSWCEWLTGDDRSGEFVSLGESGCQWETTIGGYDWCLRFSSEIDG
jgi:hypothetical protein